MACLFGHKWNGCKCDKCGKVRDEQHKWDGNQCSGCNRVINKQAVHMITDQNVLATVAQNAKDTGVRITAIEKLTDQNLLISIAKDHKDYNIRLKAVEKITDKNVVQKTLFDIAKNGKNSDMRINAMEKLKELGMADKEITKMLCDAGKHTLVFVKTKRTEPSQTADSADFGIAVNIFKCTDCDYKEGVMPSGVKYHGSLE